MFNFNAVNTAEVNATSRLPDEPVLSILASEDVNSLSWTSPYFTDFFTLYWSNKPFAEFTENGVHAVNYHPGVSLDPATLITYVHSIPASFSLSVLYYRVDAYNRNSDRPANDTI